MADQPQTVIGRVIGWQGIVGGGGGMPRLHSVRRRRGLAAQADRGEIVIHPRRVVGRGVVRGGNGSTGDIRSVVTSRSIHDMPHRMVGGRRGVVRGGYRSAGGVGAVMRHAPGSTIGRPEMQAFTACLGASKGVFVTTSAFSAQAIDFASRIPQRVVLIDRKRLTELMVERKSPPTAPLRPAVVIG